MITVSEALRCIPTNRRLYELRCLRKDLLKERCGKTQSLLLGARAAPHEVRWVSTRRAELIRGFLESRAMQSRDIHTIGPLEIREFLWPRVTAGRIQLRTLASYQAEIQRELEALKSNEEAMRRDGALLRRLATMIKPQQAIPLTEAETESLLLETEGSPRSLVAALWLSGGRREETLEGVPADFAMENGELRWSIRSKGGQCDWSRPLRITVEQNTLRGRCAMMVFEEADAARLENRMTVWDISDWEDIAEVQKSLKGERLGAYAFRRGSAQDVAYKAEQEARAAAERAASVHLRHKTTRHTPRYLL